MHVAQDSLRRLAEREEQQGIEQMELPSIHQRKAAERHQSVQVASEGRRCRHDLAKAFAASRFSTWRLS